MIPCPSHPAVTTPYGKPGSWSGGTHGGADFGSSGIGGAPVVAPWGGTVTSASWGGAYGTQLVIDFDPLPDGSPGLWGVLAHLQDKTVSPGHRVAAGQPVGHVDSSGNSTGHHLHLEVQRQAHWVSGGHVNPQPWIDAGGGGAAPSWMLPAGHTVYADYLRWRGHEQNSDDVSDSIRAWQEMLNAHPLTNGADLPVTGQWFDLTAAETQKCQAQHIPPADQPLEAVYVGPKQFEHVRAETGCPYIWVA